MMHPSRTQHTGTSVGQAMDFGEVKYHWKRVGNFDTNKRAWGCLDEDADYHLVVRMTRLSKILRGMFWRRLRKDPRTHLALFWQQKAVWQNSKVAPRKEGWNVGCLKKRCSASRLFRDAGILGEIKEKLENHDDTAIAHYLKIELPVWYPMPAACWPQGKSLVKAMLAEAPSLQIYRKWLINFHHIWIGQLPRPAKWMDTRTPNIGWNYTLWDNDKYLAANGKSNNWFFASEKWHGVADVAHIVCMNLAVYAGRIRNA